MATETKERSGSRRRAGSGDTNANADDRRFLEQHGEQLSPSTKRARWIHSSDERPARKGQTLATRSTDVIRAWAEARDGRPAATRSKDGGDLRVLRMRFGDAEGGRLEEVSWEEWFRTFEDRNLVFIYQEERRDGRQSNFFRLDNPEREDG
jgi:hypothetical protein